MAPPRGRRLPARAATLRRLDETWIKTNMASPRLRAKGTAPARLKMRLEGARLGRRAIGAHLRLCRVGLLSLIISEAMMMLADDEHIEDKSIMRQIKFQR
ncbi:hypothetical protein ACVDG8_002140 [Mesorhizobium sp. ORM8.1]